MVNFSKNISTTRNRLTENYSLNCIDVPMDIYQEQFMGLIEQNSLYLPQKKRKGPFSFLFIHKWNQQIIDWRHLMCKPDFLFNNYPESSLRLHAHFLISSAPLSVPISRYLSTLWLFNLFSIEKLTHIPYLKTWRNECC